MNKKYNLQFSKKKNSFDKSIDPYCNNKSYFKSKSQNFRTRIEFGIKSFNGKLGYSMIDNGVLIEIKELLICHERINTLMKEVLVELEEDRKFSEEIFQIEFQVSRNNEAIIGLIYHRNLDKKWEEKAKNLCKNLNCSIVGRSRKQNISIGNNYVTEIYKSKTHQYPLQLFEQCFSQTNPGICDDMLTWVEDNAYKKEDILELHCGVGTFTVLFSKMYANVFATENSRPSIKGLKDNLILNNACNVVQARLSGSETLDALSKKREFRRLKEVELDKFNFSTIFLDPPRDGLDSNTLKQASLFEEIIYISCGFKSLVTDLKELNETHIVKSAALFDQFPYTSHIETGFILEKR